VNPTVETGVTRSADGTPIGYFKLGSGPPVVIVHGALCTHEDWMAVARELSTRFTCYVMDRRGRGMSGDASGYTVERELADIGAMLNAAGQGASLVGHSFGAFCALLAALQAPVSRLVVYEPPWPIHGPAHGRSAVLCPALIEQGRSEDALVLFLREIGMIPPGLMGRLFTALPAWIRVKLMPSWTSMVALMPVTTREIVAVDGIGKSLERFTALKMPTLFLLGAQSQQPHIRDTTLALVKLVPNATLCELPKQGHMAQLFAPKVVAEQIAGFLVPTNQAA
jgi:pimeloyl-ACP methyl ester carboxylesterase